ncbi:MAG TPA: tetratricopeptide repeat protein [Planctomycetota bacterium]|nr:tetratricopeptide repeat protein [Planctomycetota bacterium]
MAHLLQKEFAKAVADIDAAIKLDAKQWEAYAVRGDAHSQLRKHDEAAADYTKLIELKPTADAYLARGRSHLAREDGKAAFADATKSLEMGGNKVKAHYIRGWGLQLQRKFDEAIAEYDKVEALDPKVDIYNLRGNARKDLGRFEEALKDFNRIIELEPESAIALNNRGHLLYELEKWDEALADLRKSMTFKAHVMTQSMFRVWLIRVRRGEKEPADEELRQGMKEIRGTLDKDGAEATAAYLLGEKSEEDLLKFAETAKEPRFQKGRRIQAWFYIGWKRLLQGDAAKAEEFFRKCAEVESASHEADSAKFQLKRMKS